MLALVGRSEVVKVDDERRGGDDLRRVGRMLADVVGLVTICQDALVVVAVTGNYAMRSCDG